MLNPQRGFVQQLGFAAAEIHVPPRPQAATTGRSIVLFRRGPEAMSAARSVLFSAAGLKSMSAAELPTGIRAAELAPSSAMTFDRIGVGVINGDPDQIGRLSIQAARSDSILAVEPERIVHAACLPGGAGLPGAAGMPPMLNAAGELVGRPPASKSITPDYMRGFRDGYDLAMNLCFSTNQIAPPAVPLAAEALFNESSATWGLQITRVLESAASGNGVKLAVLDTGFTLSHPDFAGRTIVAESFVSGQTAADQNGHGTHCLGTAAGPRVPSVMPRYGIAYDCTMYMGKVLSDQGSGTDGSILAGIDWAITQGCQVISMSFGAAPGPKPSTVYENVARRALDAGTLLIAAAGNESRRADQPPYIAPVDHPANCPSIMAVGAVDPSLRIAWFSCGGLSPNGGQVDIVAPGLNVRSSWLLPQQYNTISGTSMATPHVAGIAALFIEANPGITATDLWTKLVKSARSLGPPAADFGSGLVQAPVN